MAKASKMQGGKKTAAPVVGKCSACGAEGEVRPVRRHTLRHSRMAKLCAGCRVDV